MKIEMQLQEADIKARAEVEQRARQRAARCYQCGKCTAGCPLVFAMGLGPTQIMRLVQLGRIDEVLNERSIWLCSACETCSTRCPQEVDIAKVMDVLRNLAHARGLKRAAPEVALAHRLFIDSIRWFGRVFEPGLVILQNLRSGHLLEDVEKGPHLLLKHKLMLYPRRIRGVGHVRRIFANVEEQRRRSR